MPYFAKTNNYENQYNDFILIYGGPDAVRLSKDGK